MTITYDINNDIFTITGNAKNPVNIISNFIRTQIGQGEDLSIPNKKEIYTINIKLYPSNDTFIVSDDCGNNGLRDGILLKYLSNEN